MRRDRGRGVLPLLNSGVCRKRVGQARKATKEEEEEEEEEDEEEEEEEETCVFIQLCVFN